ncbi:helix-turn-helix domain-containing protein [Inquilinus limosus]|uniref:helix-turn-helix domain-containing protein n=1 Tax=Inquilinus limosus TaxID=171674 RepID=UPI00068CA39C|nr:helix-turn-helix domain-containing protein [Inquilinus limosus]
MDEPFEGLTYRFTTKIAKPRERFDAWRSDVGALFDISDLDGEDVSYDSQFGFTLLDQMMFGGRDWLRPASPVTHAMSRDPRKIRTDGLDHYYLQLQISETLRGQAGDASVHVGPGDLCLLDLAAPFALEVTTGNTICMVIPRDMLPAGVASLHGRSLRGGLGGLLADHLHSLRRHLPGLTRAEAPYAIQATKTMLLACLMPTSDTLAQAGSELDAALVGRIRRYIDETLMSPDLSPDRICREVGISRSKLYRLFEPTGGVMRLIQRKRLRRARQALANPLEPRARIGDVAWRHGFANEKHFSRLFKTEFGHSPSEIPALDQEADGPSAVEDRGTDEGHRSFGDWLQVFMS